MLAKYDHFQITFCNTRISPYFEGLNQIFDKL